MERESGGDFLLATRPHTDRWLRFLSAQRDGFTAALHAASGVDRTRNFAFGTERTVRGHGERPALSRAEKSGAIRGQSRYFAPVQRAQRRPGAVPHRSEEHT